MYLFRKGGTDFGDNSPKKYKAIPPAVQTIVKDPSIIIPFEVSDLELDTYAWLVCV